jgi:hypothetical protein
VTCLDPAEKGAVFRLSLERQDVENALSCIDEVSEASQLAPIKQVLGALISKIESQSGVKLEEHAPCAVPSETAERMLKRFKVVLPTDKCTFHPLDMLGKTCWRCGEVA